MATSTDESGSYRLDLDPGDWVIETDLFSFEKQKKTVAQAETSSSLQWDLSFPLRADPGAGRATEPQPAPGSPQGSGFQTAQLKPCWSPRNRSRAFPFRRG